MTDSGDHGTDRYTGTAGTPDRGLAAVRHAIEHAADSTGEQLGEAEWIDRIAELESLQNSLAALQSAAVYEFARAHVARRTAAGTVEPEKLERDIAGQVAPACRVSPTEGSKRVRTARDLRCGLDHVRRLFQAGRLSSYRVTTIVTATAHLDSAERAEVDRRLAEHDLERMGVGRLRERTRSLAALVAPDKFRTRVAAARTGRRVCLRPAADGMTDLIAHLPVEQGVACLAALQKAVVEASVNPEPMTRGRGQLMADTLVERLTGQATAEQVNVEVQVLVPVEALIDPGSPLPAEIPGHGPVPADLLTTTTGRATWRRLITRAGIVIGGDTHRRTFPRYLTEFIRARDGNRCTEPYCDAPARQTDHIQKWSHGGRSTFTNSRSVCAFHNYLREQPGWQVTRTPNGIRTTTPTGHHYLAAPHRYLDQLTFTASSAPRPSNCRSEPGVGS